MPIFINAAAVKELTNSAYASTGKGFACKTSEDMIDIFLSVGSGDVVISGRLTPSTRDFTYYPYATKGDLFSDRGTITTGGDLNSAITPGFYRYNGSPENIPQANDWGVLLVFKSVNYTLQIASPGLTRLFVRGRVGQDPWINWSEH